MHHPGAAHRRVGPLRCTRSHAVDFGCPVTVRRLRGVRSPSAHPVGQIITSRPDCRLPPVQRAGAQSSRRTDARDHPCRSCGAGGEPVRRQRHAGRDRLRRGAARAGDGLRVPPAGPRCGRGYGEHARHCEGGAGGGVRVPEPPVQDPRLVRRPRLPAAVPAPRRHRCARRSQPLLRRRRRRVRAHRLPRHVARGPGERPCGRGGPRERPRRGHAHRLPHRRHRRHVHRRPGPARRLDRRAHLPRRRPGRARGFRLRRRAARDVHACRRRYLHQGRGRRRRPRGQGRAGHPRGRPPQRRHHRRQRRRQRRRLRRHGRGPLRVLRRHAGRRAHPGQGRVRRAGPGVPAHRPRHRRRHRRDRRLHHPRAPRPERPRRHQPRLLHLGRHLRRALLRRRAGVPALVVPRLHGRGRVRRRRHPRPATAWRSAPSSSASCSPA